MEKPPPGHGHLQVERANSPSELGNQIGKGVRWPRCPARKQPKKRQILRFRTDGLHKRMVLSMDAFSSWE